MKENIETSQDILKKWHLKLIYLIGLTIIDDVISSVENVFKFFLIETTIKIIREYAISDREM